ncbi:hypothetical protein KAH55_03170 [bacterium]|nr:hypothetical protein [bacterium]
MKLDKTAFFFSILIMLPCLLSGQIKIKQAPSDVQQMMQGGYDQVGNFSILGMQGDNFSMSHNYSMSFSSFGSGNSVSQGMYLNTMNYQFSIPMTLSVQWGMMYQPSATGVFDQNSSQGMDLFFSGAELNYRPNDKTSLHIGIYRRPKNYYSPYAYSPYGNGFNSGLLGSRNNSWWERNDFFRRY